MGPPGAGKGTQGIRIAQRCGVPSISTGDIFRANVDDGTVLGVQAKDYMNRGAYVPDELTNALVTDRLSFPDAREGFLLDGFPRTLEQVHTLDEQLEASGVRLDAAIRLEVDVEEVVRRLLERALQQGRPDDTEVVIRSRLAIYREQTHPLAAIYADRGILVSVDAEGTIDEVTARVLAGLEARSPVAESSTLHS